MLAVVRELWRARDEVASRRDIAVGRVLPDSAIIAAATALPASKDALGALKEFSGRGQQRRLNTWWHAVESALALPEDQLPPGPPPASGPPPPRTWADRDPEAFARLEAARAGIARLVEQVSMPAENILTPDFVRRLCWQPPDPPTLEAVSAVLAAFGARPWQIELTAGPLAAACAVSRG